MLINGIDPQRVQGIKLRKLGGRWIGTITTRKEVTELPFDELRREGWLE